MNHQNEINECIKLMHEADAVIFTTMDENQYPNTRAMLNLRNVSQFPELVDFFKEYDVSLTVFLTTNTSSVKYKQIEENSKVSLYYCQAHEWHGIMVSGDIEIVKDMNLKKRIWQNNWDMYYPGGAESEDYAILQLKPKLIKSYNKFQRFEIKM